MTVLPSPGLFFAAAQIGQDDFAAWVLGELHPDAALCCSIAWATSKEPYYHSLVVAAMAAQQGASRC